MADWLMALVEKQKLTIKLGQTGVHSMPCNYGELPALIWCRVLQIDGDAVTVERETGERDVIRASAFTPLYRPRSKRPTDPEP